MEGQRLALAPDAIIFGRRIVEQLGLIAPNPHPAARCAACSVVKPCVAWAACSSFCADLLGLDDPPAIAPARAWER